MFEDAQSTLKEVAPKLAAAAANIIGEIGSSMPFIGPVFKALLKVKKYVDAQKIKNSSKVMINITHNITAFDDMVSKVAIEIIKKKQQQILNSE